MTPLERLIAAGITPCAACVWRFDEVVRPCFEHLARIRDVQREHIDKLTRQPRRSLVRDTRDARRYKVA